MPSEATLQDLADRIALARRNISELMERATARRCSATNRLPWTNW
jgi:predicted DNA binding protein